MEDFVLDNIRSFEMINLETGEKFEMKGVGSIEPILEPQTDITDEKIDKISNPKSLTMTFDTGYIDPITMAEIFHGSCFTWYQKLWIRFWSRIKYFIESKRWIRALKKEK